MANKQFSIGRVVQFESFDSTYYNCSYRYLIKDTPELVITTADLVSTLYKVQSNFDIERNSTSWRTLTSLGILAKEGLVDLTIQFRSKEESYAIVNLTPVDNPYWSVVTIEKCLTENVVNPIVQGWDTAGNYRINYFARPVGNAKEKLLEKSNNDWEKVWYTQKPLTKEEVDELTKDQPTPMISLNQFPETAKIIPEQSFVIEL